MSSRPCLHVPQPYAFALFAYREALPSGANARERTVDLPSLNDLQSITGRDVPELHAAGEPACGEGCTVGRESQAEQIDVSALRSHASAGSSSSRGPIRDSTIRCRTGSKANPAAASVSRRERA